MNELLVDKGFISRLKTGDSKSIKVFMDTYGRFIYHVTYKVLLQASEAEEATQDTILKVIKALDTYDLKSSFKAWCYTIAWRTAIDYKRRLKYTVDIHEGMEVISSVTSDAIIHQSETQSNIKTLLSHLDEESRLIISLYYLEEKNIRELIDITGLTESNLKVKLFRARKELAKHAGKYFEQI